MAGPPPLIPEHSVTRMRAPEAPCRPQRSRMEVVRMMETWSSTYAEVRVMQTGLLEGLAGRQVVVVGAA